MVFEKVVYVRYLPLTKAIYTDLYFDELIQNDIEVEYLDVTALFYPDRINIEPFFFAGSVKILSYKQLKKYLKNQNNKNTLYISVMTYEWRVFRLFWLFSVFNVKLAVFARGVFPDSSEPTKAKKILEIMRSLSFGRCLNFFGNKIAILSKKYGLIKPYTYIFKAGEFGYKGIGIGNEIDLKNAVVTELNTVDYDQFLSEKELPSRTEGEYIVFLDQYLPYHPDASFFKIKTVEPARYFIEVNAFLDKLELCTGKKVVIAAHPKAEHYLKLNPYNGRALYFNQSNSLVKDACFVLTHASTAICFPICYEKKLILLMSDHISEVLPYFLVIARSIVEACGATLIAIDNQEAVNIPQTIDIEKYQDFKYKYLTSCETESELSVNIFIKFMKKDHSHY